MIPRVIIMNIIKRTILYGIIMMFFVTHPDLFITNTIQNSSRTSCQFEQKLFHQLLGVENTNNTNHNAILRQRLDQELSRIQHQINMAVI